jgi:hypothetical protein
MSTGDRLARGDKSAQFSVGSAKSDLEWDLSVLSEKEFLSKYVGTTRARYLELLEQRMKGNA